MKKVLDKMLNIEDARQWVEDASICYARCQIKGKYNKTYSLKLECFLNGVFRVSISASGKVYETRCFKSAIREYNSWIKGY